MHWEPLWTLIVPIAGLSVAVIAIVIIVKSKNRFRSRLFVIAGLCAGCFAVLLLTGVAISDGLEGARMQTCVANMKQIAEALYAYANKNQGMFPPIDTEKNSFTLSTDLLYPGYLRDISVLTCPSSQDPHSKNPFLLRSTRYHSGSAADDAHFHRVTGESYCYIGWALTSEEEAKAFFEAYDKLSPAEKDVNLVVPDGKGNPCELNLLQPNPKRGNVIHRLSEDVESGFYQQQCKDAEFDPQNFVGSTAGWFSDIPIIWDRHPYHEGSRGCRSIRRIWSRHRGGNVLYLDGHVEFWAWGEQFPMTEAVARMLDERKRRPIPDCDE